MTAFETDWKKFAASVIPVAASEIQKANMRDAFYGGAWIAFNIISEISVKTPDEDVAMLKVEEFNQELKRYFADRKAGKI